MSIDFTARKAVFTLSVWVGSMLNPPGPEREKYRKGRLTLVGLEYLAIEPPQPDYPYGEGGSIRIDLDDPDDAVAGSRPHAKQGFAGRFFVSEWNSFIHFAAEDATLEWLEP